MIVTFDGSTVSAYQAKDVSYTIERVENTLMTGLRHVRLSNIAPTFPRAFDCYTASYSEISTLAAKIGSFGTLVIDGTSFSDCYISQLSNIKELIYGSGKYTYSITFGQTDLH